MTWPPAYPSPYYNLTKKEQAEYDAVVERDGDRCIECSGAWGVFHHVLYGDYKREVDRDNMVLLCNKPCHGTGLRGAHGIHAKAKREKYLRYLKDV